MLYHERRRRRATQIQALARRYFKRKDLTNLLFEKFPFSGGYWNKLWHAFALQRRVSAKEMLEESTDLEKVQAALWFATMETPVSYQISDKLFKSVIDTQGKVNANANFGYGILLLTQEKDFSVAKPYIENGFAWTLVVVHLKSLKMLSFVALQ